MIAQDSNIAIAFDGVSVANLDRQMKSIQDFQALVRSQFKENIDFGVVPGSKKLSMLKPGAEKTLMLMGMSQKFEKETCTRDYENGFVSYDFICRLFKNGFEVTQGFGTANSKEPKYASQNIYGIDNTLMKMAKKRALVDAALLVGSLSDIFTADIEDMDDLQGNKAKDYKQQATDTSGCISQAQAKRMFAMSQGNQEIVIQAMKAHGYEGKKSTDVQKVDYNRICKEIEEIVNGG
jgi:hypothetical protein